MPWISACFFSWWRPRQTSWILQKRCVRLVDIDANCFWRRSFLEVLKWNEYMDGWTMDGEKLEKNVFSWCFRWKTASSLLLLCCLTRPSGLAWWWKVLETHAADEEVLENAFGVAQWQHLSQGLSRKPWHAARWNLSVMLLILVSQCRATRQSVTWLPSIPTTSRPGLYTPWLHFGSSKT